MKLKKNLNFLVLSVLLPFSLFSCAQSKENNIDIKPAIINSKYVDLTYAAEHSVNAVVYIKTEFLRKNSVWDKFFGENFLEIFFGVSPSRYPIVAAGSGVIVSQDGYIVTNNHVVQDANKITVTLSNKREYNATLVGTDPNADLALIKIDETSLEYLFFGNSDDVRIGEWVLAVGNPFNLTSTVTAGIVSAKARNLNILGENTSVETFIQTDAAVNQGNSGGALVNTKGELIGINTAIASENGYFTGYSFAIPSNIVKKAVEDFIKYGTVKRVSLGIKCLDIDQQIAQQLDLTDLKGIYIAFVEKNSSAEIAGLLSGDIILSIDKKEINSFSQLKEVLLQQKAGNSINIQYLRNNKIYSTKAILK